MVVEHGVDPLLPLATIVDQRMAKPDSGAQIEQMIGHDPALRQTAGQQQLAQVLGVGTVGLGVLLLSAQRSANRCAALSCASADPVSWRQPTP
jgi:hypothetical protein